MVSEGPIIQNSLAVFRPFGCIFIIESRLFTMPEIFSLLSLLMLGFVLGLQHALDADHVAAVSAIASETKSVKKSSILGIFWGLGHTATLLFAGAIALLLKIAIPQKLALSFELLVGIMLVVLGFDVLRKAASNKVHLHFHEHDGKRHVHFHSHANPSSHIHTHAHKSFIVGAIHGLAGSAALMLLVLSTVDSVFSGLLYIVVFGLGSIAAMLTISTIIGLPFKLTSNFGKVNGAIKLIAGAASVVLGASIIYGIFPVLIL